MLQQFAKFHNRSPEGTYFKGEATAGLIEIALSPLGFGFNFNSEIIVMNMYI